jgi:hypothetical protein
MAKPLHKISQNTLETLAWHVERHKIIIEEMRWKNTAGKRKTT